MPQHTGGERFQPQTSDRHDALRLASTRLLRPAACALCLAGLLMAMTCALLAGKTRAAYSMKLTVSGAASLKDALR